MTGISYCMKKTSNFYFDKTSTFQALVLLNFLFLFLSLMFYVWNPLTIKISNFEVHPNLNDFFKNFEGGTFWCFSNFQSLKLTLMDNLERKTPLNIKQDLRDSSHKLSSNSFDSLFPNFSDYLWPQRHQFRRILWPYLILRRKTCIHNHCTLLSNKLWALSKPSVCGNSSIWVSNARLNSSTHCDKS